MISKPISRGVDAWLIYALGGGFGHLTRACALARVAEPGTRVRILTNSPYAACVRQAMPEVEIIIIDPAIAIEEARVAVRREIESATPDVLIVDTFPRGLASELADILPSLTIPKILVQRDLNPRYAAAYDLNTFVKESYDLVLVPGDAMEDVPPWLVRSHDELLSRDRAREILRLEGDGPCVVVCAAGNPDELAWYGDVTARLESTYDVRCIAPVCPDTCPRSCWIPYWPALDLYDAADVVIGGAGYNTVNECLACNVPLVARSWPRKYDRQKERAMRAGIMLVDDAAQAAAAAIQLLHSAPRIQRASSYKNGARDAAFLVKNVASKKRA